MKTLTCINEQKVWFCVCFTASFSVTDKAHPLLVFGFT